MAKGFKKESNERDPSFAELITNKVCGGHNQNSMILFNGRPGSGKSLASIRLAFDLSLLFAERLSTETKQYHPTDFFTLDNIAVLTAEETIRVAKNTKQYQIIIIDDGGCEGMAARQWQSKQNQIMVKLMQSWRTRNGVLIISSPSADLVDKIARGLIEYRVFMTTPFFEQNFTLGKLSTVKRISTKDGGSNHYPFLKAHGKIFNYVRFFLPPKDMQKSYEKKRKRLEQEMNLRSIQEMEDENSTEDKTEAKKAKDTEDAARKTHAMLYKSYVKGGVKAGEACKMATEVTGLDLSQNTILRDYNRLCLEV